MMVNRMSTRTFFPTVLFWLRQLIMLTILSIGLAIMAVWLLRAWVQWSARDNIHTVESAPKKPVALVLGAGLWRDGSPTPVLRDRVITAVELYKAGRVSKLLMSGDNQYVTYNEPAAMRRLALQLGVPDEDIVLDYAGRRTYDSCYRAYNIFDVPEVTVVTQQFHLGRALYLCNALGAEAVGVAADRQNYRASWQRFWQMREVAATVRAWLDINLLKPQPVMGDKLPIGIASEVE
jgi:SanA protein